MKRCIVFLNGVMDNYTFFKIKESDYVIAADGGMRHAVHMTEHIDLWVGDFDSYKVNDLPESITVDTVKTFNADKDYTDGELALIEASKDDYDEIVLLGGLGGRRDHELANMMLLFGSLPVRIESSSESIYPLKGKMELNFCTGKTVSVIPLTEEIIITIQGVKFPLDKHLVKFASTHTMSNVVEDEKAIFDCHEGRALLIVNREVNI